MRVLLRVCLGHVALVFPLELADDLELWKSPRACLSMMLECELWKHDRRSVYSQLGSWVVGSQDSGANLTGQSSHLTLVNVSKRMEVFMEQSVEDVGVECLSILRNMRDLVE